MSRVTPEHLSRLLEKYRVLARLRAEREAAIGQGLSEFEDGDKIPRRDAMKTLAREFPGALRELDEATAAELTGRLEALDSGARAPWMDAAVLFHWALREALALRRVEKDASTFWSATQLAVVRAPPTGRLLDVVWTAVADELGLSPGDAERLVYPRAPVRGLRA